MRSSSITCRPRSRGRSSLVLVCILVQVSSKGYCFLLLMHIAHAQRQSISSDHHSTVYRWASPSKTRGLAFHLPSSLPYPRQCQSVYFLVRVYISDQAISLCWYGVELLEALRTSWCLGWVQLTTIFHPHVRAFMMVSQRWCCLYLTQAATCVNGNEDSTCF